MSAYNRHQLVSKNTGLKQYQSEQYGSAIQILNYSSRKNFSIASINVFILPPIKLGQIQFAYCKRSGEPRGYMTWAYVTEEVSSCLKSDQKRILSLDEWNEGDLLWITDIVAPFGDARAILSHFIESKNLYGERVQAVRFDRKTVSYIDTMFPSNY